MRPNMMQAVVMTPNVTAEMKAQWEKCYCKSAFYLAADVMGPAT